jgi:hypothetical protein
MNRSISRLATTVMILAACSGPAVAQVEPRPIAQSAMDASTRMNELGAENGQLVGREGAWTVTETLWDTAGAAPKVTRGLLAERRMVGSMLQEILRDPRNPQHKILRLDYLSFDRVEGRWKYVSMDTRAPVGIMTAESLGRAKGDTIEIDFQPFALAGSGQSVSGQMLRMRQDIVSSTADHDRKDQYFTLADGTGTEWLAHRYDYVRHSDR